MFLLLRARLTPVIDLALFLQSMSNPLIMHSVVYSSPFISVLCSSAVLLSVTPNKLNWPVSLWQPS